ncbi:uncharacterized protein [Arachis hypogaea]|uniref:uncharacterized protein n=1 Tax=Arachis hypogaea TaxID=3818 RepID=UPI003B22217C
MADVPPPSLSELMRMVAELQQANQRITDENQIMAAQIAELNHVRIEHNDTHHQQLEDNEHHFQPSHVSETIRADVIHPEDEKEESDELVGPFTEEVMNFELPKRFTLPLTLTPYDGLGDPKKFLKKFRSIMIVNGASDTVLCRCFPNYLDGPALDWLCTLPAGSVSRFQQLAKLFEEHFAGSTIYLHDSDYLNTIKQGQNKSLKDYMTRFTKVAISIPDLHPEVHLHAIKSGLRPRKFQETIAVAKPKTLAEFREKAKGQIDIEELRQVRKSDKTSHRDDDKTPNSKKDFKLTPRFDSYTHAFHQKHGHSTDDCVIAKDLLERLARQGHLDKYIGSHIQKRSTLSRNEDSSEQQYRGREKVAANNYEKPRGVINYISGGYASGGSSNSARKRSFRAICSLKGPQNETENPTQLPQLTFTQGDYNSRIQNLDDPIVITLQLGDLLVKKVLLDPGSSADVLFYSTFQKMKLSNNILQSTGGDLVGFSGERVPIIGSVWLQTTLGEHPLSKTCDIQYLVVDCFSPYNIILGRPFLNKFGAIVSTVHLCVKFPLQDDHIVTIHGDYKEARHCYNIGMKFQNYSKQQVNNVDLTHNSSALADLDPRTDFQERPTSSDDLQKVYFNNDPNKFTFVGNSISKEELNAITTFLQQQADLFSWKPSDIPGIDPQIISHKLAINSSARSVQQKKRKLDEEKRKASLEETQKLISAEFIKEIRFTTWLANVVMVRKQNERSKIQQLVYFVSKILHHAELNYPRIEKLALALVFSARRLRLYFQSYVINVRTDHPLRQVLHKPDIAGRLIKWSIELSEFDIRYQSRGAIKSQFLADFVAELTLPSEDDHTKQWTLYIDGSSNKEGCGAGIRLEADDGSILEHSLHLSFKASNNQSEYEALVVGLRLCLDLQIHTIKVYCDSLLVVQ